MGPKTGARVSRTKVSVNCLRASQAAKQVAFLRLSAFATLIGSAGTGALDLQRLTNLMHLNVDTSWFIRYRSATNPDFGATFPQAVTIKNRTAIPRNDDDFDGTNHIQVIANMAAFHFGMIEQGDSSLYQALGRKVTSLVRDPPLSGNLATALNWR